ncbi:hypothetical protein [Nonomuraea dietziae]|uniref:hypothetical protein n=1 Tax=Nonomuraea dietziae TaxID=65515 RepID=UPI0031D589CF
MNSTERRRILAAAALGRTPGHAGPDRESGDPLHAVTGQIVDVSPHLLIVETEEGSEERLVIAPWATAWHGADVAPGDLPLGSRVIIRALRDGKVVERVWADLTRMTGTILSIEGRRDLHLELDCGPHRGRRSVVIPYRTTGRVRVRHPQLEPGYLFDAIGVREDGVGHALLPATSQPAYPARARTNPSPRVRRATATHLRNRHLVRRVRLRRARRGLSHGGALRRGLPRRRGVVRRPAVPGYGFFIESP